MFDFFNRIYFLLFGSYLKPIGAFYSNHQYRYFKEYIDPATGLFSSLIYKTIFFNLKHNDVILYVRVNDNHITVCIDRIVNTLSGLNRIAKIIKFPIYGPFINKFNVEYTYKDELLTLYVIHTNSYNGSDKTIRELLMECGEINE